MLRPVPFPAPLLLYLGIFSRGYKYLFYSFFFPLAREKEGNICCGIQKENENDRFVLSRLSFDIFSRTD